MCPFFCRLIATFDYQLIFVLIFSLFAAAFEIP